MNAKLNYGIIGCGVIGPTHAHAINHIKNARLVGTCDVIDYRAQELGDRFHAEFFTTEYQELLARPDIDAVCICTPHYLHAEMAIAAARAGKHIFCEKPMANSVEQMDAMIAAADAAGVQLGVCFQHRFDPVMRQMKQLVEEGKFGHLLLGGAHCRCLRDANYYLSEAWRGTWAQEGGGVLINQAIHTIDLLLWMFGEPNSISGQSATLAWGDLIEVEDTATGVISFTNGAQGHIAASSASAQGWSSRLQIFGTEGSAEINSGFPKNWTVLELASGTPEIASDEETAGVGKDYYGNSHRPALQCFTDSILNGHPYPIDGREARRAVEVILALYRSSSEGKPIALPLTAAAQSR